MDETSYKIWTKSEFKEKLEEAKLNDINFEKEHNIKLNSERDIYEKYIMQLEMQNKKLMLDLSSRNQEWLNDKVIDALYWEERCDELTMKLKELMNESHTKDE